MEKDKIPYVTSEIVDGVENFELDSAFLYDLLTVKVNPQVTSPEVKDLFNKKYPIKDLPLNQLIILQEVICHLFETLRKVSELKRNFSDFDDYLARYDTFLTIFSEEIKNRQ